MEGELQNNTANASSFVQSTAGDCLLAYIRSNCNREKCESLTVNGHTEDPKYSIIDMQLQKVYCPLICILVQKQYFTFVCNRSIIAPPLVAILLCT